MQLSIFSQKNIVTSVNKLEAQIGQLAKQLTINLNMLCKNSIEEWISFCGLEAPHTWVRLYRTGLPIIFCSLLFLL